MDSPRTLAPLARRAHTGAPAKVHEPSVVSKDAQIGHDAVVGAFCFVAAGAVIGAGTRIQSHTSVWSGVRLGRDVFVGPGAMFTNVRHPRAAFPRAPNFDETRVDDGATIGERLDLYTTELLRVLVANRKQVEDVVYGSWAGSRKG